MNILALDFGTKTGFCRGVTAGTWVLATKDEVTEWGKDRMNRRRDPRISRLYLNLLNENPDLVVFEDVEFRTTTYQCQLWASFRAAAWLAFPNAVFECVPVATLKKFATGYGGADKALMKKYLCLRHPEVSVTGLDDNAIDATWIYLWAKTNLARLRA